MAEEYAFNLRTEKNPLRIVADCEKLLQQSNDDVVRDVLEAARSTAQAVACARSARVWEYNDGATATQIFDALVSHANAAVESALRAGGAAVSDLIHEEFHRIAQGERHQDRTLHHGHRRHDVPALAVLFRETEASQPPVELIFGLDELIARLKEHPSDLHSIPPRRFEELVAGILAGCGWKVQLTPQSKDGGYDIFAISRDDIAGVKTAWMIECKRYADHRKIGVDIVRQLLGARELSKQNTNLLLATTSSFTSRARNYEETRYDLELKDFEAIVEWINGYRPNPNGRLYIRDNKLVLPGDDEYPE